MHSQQRSESAGSFLFWEISERSHVLSRDTCSAYTLIEKGEVGEGSNSDLANCEYRDGEDSIVVDPVDHLVWGMVDFLLEMYLAQ